MQALLWFRLGFTALGGATLSDNGSHIETRLCLSWARMGTTRILAFTTHSGFIFWVRYVFQKSQVPICAFLLRFNATSNITQHGPVQMLRLCFPRSHQCGCYQGTTAPRETKPPVLYGVQTVYLSLQQMPAKYQFAKRKRTLGSSFWKLQ